MTETLRVKESSHEAATVHRHSCLILLLMVPAIGRADAIYTFSGSTVPSAYIPSTDAWSAT